MAACTANAARSAGTSAAAGVPPVIRGQYGNLAAPSIVGFTIDDPNNGDEAYGSGDVITIVMDRPVDRTDDLTDAAGGGKAAVDALFSFTTPLGADYRGAWNDTSTFVIDVSDVDGAGAVRLGAHRVERAGARAAARERDGRGPVPVGGQDRALAHGTRARLAYEPRLDALLP